MPTMPAATWRDCVKVHPAAANFPRMTSEEARAFAEDIKKNGQRQPIAIIERARRRPDGTLHVSDPPLQEVLDGISRLDAMEAAGIAVIDEDGQLHEQVLRTVVDTDEVDPVAYVISANIHRRHLTGEQKQKALVDLVAAQPGKSDRELAKQAGVSHPSIAKARRTAEATGKALPVEKRVGADGKSRKRPAIKPRKAKPAKAAPPPAADVQAIRDAAAERILALMGKPEPRPRDDIGPGSASEAARLRSCVETLQAEKRRLELKVAGLERKLKELRGKLATATGGDMSISEFQAAIKKWEETVEVQRGIIARLENENASLRARAAAPPDDPRDPGPIPASLDRTRQGANL